MDNLIKNKYGYYSVQDIPSQVELEEYYAKKYYQEAEGGFEKEYSEAEVTYFKNKIAERAFILEKSLAQTSSLSLLDVGCGEGWALSFFKKKGWDVLGLDYSSYACKKFNPDCFENFIAGDVYKNLESVIQEGRTFDVIWIDNVLEHVVDPEALINELKKLIKPNGIMVAEVPNDFSVIQNYLLDKKHIDRKYWIALPDHLSYFSKEGLENLFHANGWETITCIADYPIDWNLLNPNTNYIMDKSKGKSCHNERVEFENLIHQQSMDKVVNFYTSIADLGLGRVISGFFRPNGK